MKEIRDSKEIFRFRLLFAMEEEENILDIVVEGKPMSLFIDRFENQIVARADDVFNCFSFKEFNDFVKNGRAQIDKKRFSKLLLSEDT